MSEVLDNLRESFEEFSTEELRLELKRREEICNLPWPREITIEGFVEIENIATIQNELSDHGIKEHSPAYNSIIMTFSGMKFGLSFHQNGTCKLVSVNGRKLETPTLEGEK